MKKIIAGLCISLFALLIGCSDEKPKEGQSSQPKETTPAPASQIPENETTSPEPSSGEESSGEAETHVSGMSQAPDSGESHMSGVPGPKTHQSGN
ncbi:MAG: hypothetical protein ACE5EK_05635 [Nitrospinales bacterium]